MAEKISFTKMHGCGNDYIYINMIKEVIANPEAAAIALSDRHKGIGSDGLVLIDRSPVPEADFSMCDHHHHLVPECLSSVQLLSHV